MTKKEGLLVVLSFVAWRGFLFVVLFFAIKFLTLQRDFLGGGMQTYLSNPYLWSWANFDGEHYLAIAKDGYLPLTYFFFPLYPLVIRFFATVFGNSLIDYLVSSLFLTHAFLLVGILGFYKLLRIDYDRKVSWLSVISLLLFPTSFYFGSVYTESLFFALAVWSFYFSRKKRWFVSGVLAALSTATRLVGLALTAGLFVEWLIQNKDNGRRTKMLPLFYILLSFCGIGAYLYYLYIRTGNPLDFFTSVGIFGAQRSASVTLLPQVFYRYVFKVLPSLNYSDIFTLLTPWFEFMVAFAFSLLSIFSFFKLRISYAVYFLLGLLIPTLSGSFSSLPRYVLVLFPAFIIGGIYLEKLGRWKYVVFATLTLGLAVYTLLFVRGYWVS